jgi:hypothetical protein
MTQAWDESAWGAFAEELDRWQAAGRTATVWWRDDDAARPDPAFDRLLHLAARTQTPLGLAIVPAWLTPEVAAAARAAPAPVAILQHGWAHANHETAPPPGERKVRPAECGGARPMAAVLAEVAEGWRRLRAAVGARALPVFVPPWNRVAPAVRAGLPALGYRALSAFGPRQAGDAVPGLGSLNCHADPVLWREGKAFAGGAATLDRLRGHLADRRTGRADPDEPTGLLTHHRDMTPAFWAFVEEYLLRLRRHPAAACPAISDLVDHAVSSRGGAPGTTARRST